MADASWLYGRIQIPPMLQTIRASRRAPRWLRRPRAGAGEDVGLAVNPELLRRAGSGPRCLRSAKTVIGQFD